MKTSKKNIPVFSTDGNYVIGEIGCGEKTLMLGETSEGTVIAYVLGIVKPQHKDELVEEEAWQSEVSEKHRLLCYAESIIGSMCPKFINSYFADREQSGKNLYGECTRIDEEDIKAADLIFDYGKNCIGVYMGNGSAVVENKSGCVIRKDVRSLKETAFDRPKHSSWDEDDACYNRRLIKLRRCMHGDDVRAVQRALVKLGYEPGKINGKYTRYTKKAVIQFQKANTLAPDGMVDYNTWKRLIGGD